MRLLVEKDLAVRCSDGVLLSTDVVRPDKREKVPALLLRTPYSKDNNYIVNLSVDVHRAATMGFAVVLQDCRGRYDSGGDFRPFVSEGRDGADAIDWIRSQGWSNGKVGTLGASYMGATQWCLAREAPGLLDAMSVGFASFDYHTNWFYQGGAFQLGFALFWATHSLGMGQAYRAFKSEADSISKDQLDNAIAMADSIESLYYRTPLNKVPELTSLAPYYREWVEQPDRRDYWDQLAAAPLEPTLNIPKLHIGGWYDIFLRGTLAGYQAQRLGGKAGPHNRLIVGPWAHGALTGIYKDRSFGFRASADVFDLSGEQLRWFEYWLLGRSNGVDREPAVRYFLMGADSWHSSTDWPPPEAEYRDMYLHSRGGANTSLGDGVLDFRRPDVAEKEDAFRYDPESPARTVGGPTLFAGYRVSANAGPADQRELELRQDVLCYTSASLTGVLRVVGPVGVTLYVSTTCLDTDFVARLVDVAPDGSSFNVAEGIVRGRYRESDNRPSLLEPGTIYRLDIDMASTAHMFRRGHRLRLSIAGSDFPRFDRNTNSEVPGYAATTEDFRVAVNRVHHEPQHPSRLTLSLLKSHSEKTKPTSLP